MAVVLDDQVVPNDVLRVSDGLMVRMSEDSSTGWYGSSVRPLIEDNGSLNTSNILNDAARSGAVNFFIALSDFYGIMCSTMAFFHRVEEGVNVIYFKPIHEAHPLWLFRIEFDSGRYKAVSEDDFDIADTFISGGVLWQYDLDFSQGTGVIDSYVEIKDSSGNLGIQADFTGTTTVTDNASFDLATRDSTLNESFPIFRLGNKVFVKVAANVLSRVDFSNTPFLTNGKIVLDKNMLVDGYFPNTNNSIAGSDKLTIIPADEVTDTVNLRFYEAGNTGTTHTVAWSNSSLTKDMLGTPAAESFVSSSIVFDSVISNNSEGVTVQLDKNYVMQVYQYGNLEDYLRRVGLFYSGDASENLLYPNLKPEGIIAKDSLGELLYYLFDGSGNVSFDLYVGEEGKVGSEFAPKTYSGTEQEVVDLLEADGYALDKNNLSGIGITPPLGMELVGYNSSVILKNYYSNIFDLPDETYNFLYDIFLENDTSVAIPDNNSTGVFTTLTVEDEVTLDSFLLNVNVTHPYKGDLTVSLISPSETVLTLHNRSGSGSDDVIITDRVVTEFSGENAKGDWILKVADLSGGDTGSLDYWSMEIGGIENSGKGDLLEGESLLSLPDSVTPSIVFSDNGVDFASYKFDNRDLFLTELNRLTGVTYQEVETDLYSVTVDQDALFIFTESKGVSTVEPDSRSSLLLEQLNQGEEVFWCASDENVLTFSIKVVEFFRESLLSSWEETFSVTVTEFDQEEITTAMVAKLQASANLADYTVTNYEYYLGIKY